jgi:hypothetical protein
MERQMEIFSVLYHEIRNIIRADCPGCAHRSQEGHLCFNYSDLSFTQLRYEALYVMRMRGFITSEELDVYSRIFHSLSNDMSPSSSDISNSSDFSDLDATLSD